MYKRTTHTHSGQAVGLRALIVCQILLRWPTTAACFIDNTNHINARDSLRMRSYLVTGWITDISGLRLETAPCCRQIIQASACIKSELHTTTAYRVNNIQPAARSPPVDMVQFHKPGLKLLNDETILSGSELSSSVILVGPTCTKWLTMVICQCC